MCFRLICEVWSAVEWVDDCLLGGCGRWLFDRLRQPCAEQIAAVDDLTATIFLSFS